MSATTPAAVPAALPADIPGDIPTSVPPARPRYRITTLGCRVNHAERRELEAILLARGLTPAGRTGTADLEVVHTCSVTNTAAAKSRQAIRRARRRQLGSLPLSPVVPHTVSGHSGCAPGRAPGRASARPRGQPRREPEVIVTGCYAATHAGSAATLAGGGRRVVPHESEDGSSLVERFARQVDQWLDEWLETRLDDRRGGRSLSPSLRAEPRPSSSGPAGPIVRLPTIPLPAVAGPAPHVRAELRIQDGCDAHCTFCVIPRIRRTLRSKTIADAVAETCRLVEVGHREVVLSGIFLGAYGHETALRRRQANRGAPHLADLVDAVSGVPGLARLRLSSLEPGDVTEDLLDAMVARAPVVVPHLHLPLQSGSDRVLRRMNRQYTLAEYLDMIDRVNERLTLAGHATRAPLPPAITTDVICGFPGETEADFERTLEVAERIGFLHMHVFPFSPRAGTAAARWTDHFVDDRTRAERVRVLISRETDPRDGLSIRARRRLLGRTVRLILEQPDRTAPDLMTGRCDHYTLVHVRTGCPRGEILEARITEVDGDRTVGEVVDAVRVRLPVVA